jgi:hypothetical protein
LGVNSTCTEAAKSAGQAASKQSNKHPQLQRCSASAAMRPTNSLWNTVAAAATEIGPT